MTKPISINNAGNITQINYDKPAPTDSRESNADKFKHLAQNSFYTGGFGYSPTDGISGSNAMEKIIVSNKQGNSVVFPVAGGQTTELLANLNQNSRTMAMGVDSDASVSTPTYAGNILGSATKNIRASANYGA